MVITSHVNELNPFLENWPAIYAVSSVQLMDDISKFGLLA